MSQPIIQTIANGASFWIRTPGVYFECYAASAEMEFKVDGAITLPLDRGTGWNQPFKQIEIQNNTGSSQTFTVISTPQIGFYDNRELAAQVAVDGGIVTNTAPLTDDGGFITPFSGSAFNAIIDATAGTVTADIVTAAANTAGIRVRHIAIAILTASAGQYAYVGAVSPQHVYAVLTDGHDAQKLEAAIDAGTALEYSVKTGVKAFISVHYDIL